MHPIYLIRPAILFGGLLGAGALVLAADPSPPIPPPSGTAAQAKNYTLYLGADLDVQVQENYCPLRDVRGDTFVVNADGKDLSIPIGAGPISLQVRSALKLTDAAARISKLSSERAYTPANDPGKRFLRQQPGTNAQDLIAKADGAYLTISILAAAGGGYPIAAAEVQAARMAAENVGTEIYAERNNVGNYASMMQAEYDKQLFDAMEVNFEVSSDKPLNQPYLVIVGRFRESANERARPRNWIFAKALQPIGTTPKKISVKQGGFPPGFVMDDLKIHLYNRGQELATNLSPKRVELTRDEACQYLILEHIAGHKGADVPAAPLLGRLPADLPARMQKGEFKQTFYVKVSQDGLPGEAYHDASCGQKIDDPYLLAVIKDLRFKPALQKGKPVEAVAPLNLSELPL